MFVDVAFPIAKPLVLTYLVPPEFESVIQPGQAVRAGVAKATRIGIVLGISTQTAVEPAKIKPLLGIESPEPLVTQELLDLCQWTAEYYCCSIGQVMRLFLNDSMRQTRRKKKKPGQDRPPAMKFVLTPAQERAFAAIAAELGSGRHRVMLLQGVTGSGKTLVYASLVRAALEMGKTALILVPEIGLTGPLLRNLSLYLGEEIALLHSNMSAGERFANWMRARTGTAKVVVGARSAVWAPLPNIGLIVVDEEHDHSYKQNENVPRYQARDVAVYRGYANNALVVLGSASPSIESATHAREGKYGLVRLTERFGPAVLPHIGVVDMRSEHAEGNWSSFSRLLTNKIRQRLADKEQIILLLNRRGFAPVLLCKACGEMAKCPHCNVTTPFHTDGRIRCHYCGYQAKAPNCCPRCGGTDIKFKGMGVQRIEQELGKGFPGARILRLDTDTTARRSAYADILADFEKGNADILLGTQMVAKGLDVANVTLVGIISADTGLHRPDFRAAETTFDLLLQVSGRCGRGAKPGEVILQTYAPEQTGIACAQTHDYETFYETEVKNRKGLGYPPFLRLVQITLAHADAKFLLQSAQEMVRLLEKHGSKSIRVMGPAPAPLSRFKGRYRMLILLKGASSRALHQAVNEALRKPPAGVQIIVDVDPYFMM